ncbi:MAG: YCF48-related protein [Xanthomonadales bacterium]
MLPNRILSRIVAAAAALFAAGTVPAQDADLDISYAENLPLVPESMFLDITRTDDGQLVAVGERGHVLLSEDGVAWKQADVVPTQTTLTTVESRNGRLWAAGHDAVIITSGDHGRTWTLENHDPERQQAVMDLYFTDEFNGVAIGSYGLYLRTADGGQTWEDVTIDEEGGYHLNGMVRFEDGRRLIAGEAGYSYRSFDDGETWEMMDMPYLGSMWGALRVGEQCVLFFGLRGHVLESCDFGTTWTEFDLDTESSISAGARFGDRTVLAANSGTVLIRDSGGPFRVYTHSSGVDFAGVTALPNGSFLLAGEDGIFSYPEQSGEEQSDD